MFVSILIAVERYSDQQIGEVKFAEADARGFGAVLAQHGFEPAAGEPLINERATKTSMESVIRTTLKRLTREDTLYLYYAGHGFSQPGGESYLTSFDTRRDDLDETSLRLSWLVQQFKAAKCKRVVMFLDTNHRGLSTSDKPLAIYSGLDDTDLKAFFASAAESVCFTSCGPSEESYPSSALRHGIWAYHLMQAFDGRDRLALESQRLTTASLQNYLLATVPASLRLASPKAIQTPSRYGSAEIDLADMKEVLARRKTAKEPNKVHVKDSILLAESVRSLKNLPGFSKSKGHYIPDRHNDKSQSFINTVVADEISDDVEAVRSALKREFKFKRLELKVQNEGDGAATITTPYFNYNLSVSQTAADPGDVVWRRTVDSIIDPDQILSNAFEVVFGELFDTVQLSLRDDVDLDQLIDAIESSDGDEVQVDYEEDERVSACVVTIKGFDVNIQVTRQTFAVSHRRTATPRRLLQSLCDIQRALTQDHHILTIPFEPIDGSEGN